MPLKGLQRPSVRPKGGVAHIEICAASEFDPLNPAGVEYAFREDSATYTQKLAEGLVIHTLTMEFPDEKGSREAVEELTRTAKGEGLVAVITLSSGEKLLAGYSARFGAGYPLRVTSTATLSGTAPADVPTLSLTLESIDADYSQTI